MISLTNKFNIWFVLHALFFVGAITSVFWLEWYWLALIFLILRLQDAIWGGCILTRLEYGSWERRYTEEHIGHLVPQSLIQILPFLIDWIFPAVLVVVSFYIDK